MRPVIFTGDQQVTAVDVAPPVPPLPVDPPVVASTPIAVNNMVLLDYQFNGMALPGGRPGGLPYERLQRHLCITEDVRRLRFWHCSNGAEVPFRHPRYALFVSPHADMSAAVVCAVTDVATTGTPLSFFDFAAGTLADAPYFAQALPVDANNVPLPAPLETYPVFGFWIDRKGQAKQHPMMIVQNATYAWRSNPQSQRCLMPKHLALVPAPLRRRPKVKPLVPGTPSSQVSRVQVGMNTDAIDQDRHHRCITTRGITVTENIQGYRPNEMWDVLPKVPLLDGPRGVCTFPYSTAIKASERDDAGDKFYVISPWSIAVVDGDGHKRTLYGLRHKAGAVPYWETAPRSINDPRFADHFEFVGESDPGMPLDWRWTARGWFLVWDRRSLKTDPNAAPIGGEAPHLPYALPSGEVINGPRCFVGDERGRVLELRFSATDRAAPCKARPWITNMGNTWGGDNTLEDNTMLVVERTKHRVGVWSMDTPETLVRVFRESSTASGGIIGPLKGGEAFQGSSATARLTPICFPESVRQWPDGSVSVGSMAQEQVRKFAPDGTMSVVANPTIDRGSVGSFFCDHAVMADGTVLTTTFFPDQHGHAKAFRPNGAPWDYTGYGYGVASGRGPDFNGAHYPVAPAVGRDGRVFMSDSGGGIDYFCGVDDYDPPYNGAQIKRGFEKFQRDGDSLVYGPYMTDAYHVWQFGKDADKDAFVRSCLALKAA